MDTQYKVLNHLYDNLECSDEIEGQSCPFADECDENDHHCIIKRELTILMAEWG